MGSLKYVFGFGLLKFINQIHRWYQWIMANVGREAPGAGELDLASVWELGVVVGSALGVGRARVSLQYPL